MTSKPNEYRLSVVSPIYNEENNIAPLIQEVFAALETVKPKGGYELILVNDGSTDSSAERIDEAAQAFPGKVVSIHLSRNFGMESALSAGLAEATGDAVILIDADLQDDPAIFENFVSEWNNGYDVVYAIRISRVESPPMRLLFWGFYRLIAIIAPIELPKDASNFALLDRKVVDTLKSMPERNRYLRGLRAWVGYRQIGVPVARRARHLGATSLGLKGQWRLAMNAIFAFSYVPIFVFRLAGAASLVASAVLIVWALHYKLVVGLEVEAWASQFVAISFFSGINLLGIGIVGEYVARIYDEVKGRPEYVVAKIVRGNEDESTRP